MTASSPARPALALVIPFAPDLTTLVVPRAAQGVFSQAPGDCMVYLGEEIHPKAVASAIGLYVAATASAAELPVPTGAGGAGLAGALLFAAGDGGAVRRRLPPADPRCPQLPSRPVVPGSCAVAHGHRSSGTLLRRLYLIKPLFMAVFGAVYNVPGYRLAAEPFGLSQTAIGLIFLVYLVGTGASAASGPPARPAVRRPVRRRGAGRRRAAAHPGGLLVAVLTGLVLITAGFFTGHSIASGAVSRTATTGRAQASALYLTAYYIGNSVGGTLGASPFHLPAGTARSPAPGRRPGRRGDHLHAGARSRTGGSPSRPADGLADGLDDGPAGRLYGAERERDRWKQYVT